MPDQRTEELAPHRSILEVWRFIRRKNWI